MILTWTNIYCLWCFIYKSFSWYSKWWFLTMWIKFLWCNCICCINLVSTWTWSSIFNVLNRIIIWITITNVGWRWGLLWINSAFSWILCNTRFFDFLLRLILRNITFSLVHTSYCFTCKSRWRFKCIQWLHCLYFITSRT